MNKTKDTIVVGFAIFASLFGAGNLVLPPFLGYNAGNDWWLVALGFMVSAVIIPLLAILAHARLQGTMLDFGNKVSPLFSLIFCTSIYLIAISLPIPRTASVTHEMAIAPFFDTSSLLTSSLYFLLVFIFVVNRNNILNILGKVLTPIIVIILLTIIGIGIFNVPFNINPPQYNVPMITGFLEGYQTYDALGGLLIGGVVIISLNLHRKNSFEEKKKIIINGGLIAALGMFLIYSGLIFIGAFYSSGGDDITRSELLIGLSSNNLGNAGSLFLSILVALACFTTAVSVIIGAADFFKGLFNNSQKVYLIVALIACILGVVIGQLDIRYIIKIAVPALLLIYPLTIVLILLNILKEEYASKIVFRAVILITFLFSIPDFLKFIFPDLGIQTFQSYIPLADHNLGWLIPAILVFVLVNFFNNKFKG